MVKWKKMNKKIAAMVLAATMLIGTSTTAFAYVDESAETNQATEKTEAVLEETEKTDTSDTAFSVPGNGEIKDDITDDSSKEFLTVTTKNNNTFYIVIDRSSTTENVYMLSQIDENDLSEFLDEKDSAPIVEKESQVVLEETPKSDSEKTDVEKGNKESVPTTNVGGLVTILLLALGGVAGYYYFKIYKKKQEEDDFENEGLEMDDGLEPVDEEEEILEEAE